MKFFFSIKTKLLIFGLCISLIPILVITLVFYISAKNVLEENSLKWMKEIAESRRTEIITFLDAKKERTQDFSSDGFIRDHLQKITNADSLLLVSELNRHLLVNKKTLDHYIDDILIVNLEGKIVASSNEGWREKNILESELFYKSMAVLAKSSVNIYIGKSIFSPELDTKSIYISANVRSLSTGEQLGIIVNVYNFASLSDITGRRTEMRQTGEVYIVDKNKTMITESRFIKNAPFHVVVDTEPVREAINYGTDMIGVYPDYRGVPIVGASAYVSKHGWVILSEIDKAEALAPLNFLGVVAIVLGVINAVAASVMGFMFVNALSKPIKILTTATKKFANEKHSFSVKINSNDEIGQLAQSFNSMTNDLEKEITGHKQTATTLFKSEQRFRTLTSNIPGAVYRCANDLTFTMEYISNFINEISGYESDDFINNRVRTFLSIIYPEDKITVQNIKNNGIERQEPFVIEYRIVNSRGGICWVSENGQGVFDTHGNLLWIDGVIFDNTEQKNTNDKIKVSLKEKDVLLREIHHRVKNNLQVISSLLKLQVDKTKDKNYIEMLQESQNRIKVMVLIHEKLYGCGDIANIDFKDYISCLVNELFRLYLVDNSKIKLGMDIGFITLGIDTAIPCGLIVNELISNCLKYAFPEERDGEINITFRRLEKQEIELTVSDNGVGIPESLDYRNTESLGLQLIVNLTEHQLDGDVELYRNNGTKFIVRFNE